MPSTSKNDSDGEFIRKMAAALSDATVRGLMVKACDESIEKYIEKTEKRLDEMDMKGERRDMRLDEIDARLDRFEQKEKDNNIVICGLGDNQTSKENIKNALNELLECNIKPSDIQYILKLRNDSGKQSENRVRVAFKQKEMKLKIAKLKKNLKGSNIWIADDLTAYGNRLAYLARQSVREKNAYQTWTYDGKVFLKVDKDSKPRKITSPHHIPGHTETFDLFA